MPHEEQLLVLVFAVIAIAFVWWVVWRDIRLQKSGKIRLDINPLGRSAGYARSNGESGTIQAIYLGLSVIAWVCIFVGSWIWCIVNYGFLLGVGLGWLPAAITATVLCWFWPIIAVGALFYGHLFFK